MSYNFTSMLAEPWKAEIPGDMIEGVITEIGGYIHKNEIVPTLELTDKDGVPYSVSMSCFALNKVYNHEELLANGYLAIRYVGLSKSIENAGNFAKLYQVAYFKPGDWTMDDEGNVSGKQFVFSKEADTRKAIKKVVSNHPFDPNAGIDTSTEPLFSVEEIEGEVRGTKTSKKK